MSIKNRPGHDTIKLCLEAGPGCHTTKADMKSAFRNLPIKKQDWKLLVMMVYHPETGRKFYFIDKCLPFGASISCSHFQRFSNSIAYLCHKRSGKKVNNYIDDFFFVALLAAMFSGQVSDFMKQGDQINFPIAPEKTEWTTPIIIFLGILIDTASQTISIPVEKRIKALNKTDEVLSKKKVTVLQLQQLTGLLNFILRAIIPGRTFTRRMYCKYANRDLKQHYHVKVNDELWVDCAMWREFLKNPQSVCTPFIDFTSYLSADETDFYTDAPGSETMGFGCIFENTWTNAMWEKNFIKYYSPSIEYLELCGGNRDLTLVIPSAEQKGSYFL